ncbi:YbaB/EbfC family nucleoid-associated protein [Prauserella cavernicola]|uniref:YbaB/EbfC family nucleoid-associated protein n=1 Tax=Prauserella cavernicola TaxID=2800127 RepID=A0A934V596_9PSEU|nr:YbaB/EbfC family nucleoid-associated protein [Prauserella cavernicola]MBK1789236.1 YbaB/EbfC family nucleoid-associated protein [Prauserella cavernicola]
MNRTAAQAQDRFARIGSVAGKAESGDGSIRVEVAPGGLLTDVTLTHAALRSGTDAVARQIVELANKATRRAGDRMYRALSPVLGPGSDQQLASLGYEPLPDDEDDAPYVGPGGR